MTSDKNTTEPVYKLELNSGVEPIRYGLIVKGRNRKKSLWQHQRASKSNDKAVHITQSVTIRFRGITKNSVNTYAFLQEKHVSSVPAFCCVGVVCGGFYGFPAPVTPVFLGGGCMELTP